MVDQMDILRKARSEKPEERIDAARQLRDIFAIIPNKEQAWNDLHRLIDDNDSNVRWEAAYTLGLAFADLPDKFAAWSDFDRLIHDNNKNVRRAAADALGFAFTQVPDKSAAWSDLILLTSDKDSFVRWGAANAVGFAFTQVPDTPAALSDLKRLASDYDRFVRVSANHYLGRASICKAIEAEVEEDFIRELENALEYFERSAAEAWYPHPSEFCLSFYRSFHVLTCKGENSESEVDKYLKEAKIASEGSKSKEILLEAVENLSAALREARNLHDLDEKKSNLKTCVQYCNNAAQLLDKTEKRAPGATKLVRRGIPIVSRRIKALFQVIEEESDKLREVTRDTPFESIGERNDERTQGLAMVEHPDEAERIMDEAVPDIRLMCNFLPERSRAIVCELQDWDKLDFNRKASLFKRAISRCSLWMEVLSQQIVEKDEWIWYLKDEVIDRLKNINYNIFKLKINSTDAADGLRALKWELDRIKRIKSDIDGLSSKIKYIDVSQQQALQELREEMPRLIGELETLVKRRDDQLSRDILEKLEDLNRSPGEEIFERAAGLASIVSLLMALV